MAAEFNLTELERKAWVSTFEDGLFDMTLGGIAILVALGPVADRLGAPSWSRFIFYAVMLGWPLVVMVGGKRLITLPRVGMARFMAVRRRRMAGARVVVATAVCLTGGLLGLMLAFGGSPGALAPLLPFVPGALVLAVFSLIAWFHQLRRLYVYAVAVAAGFLALELGIGPAPLLATGVVMVLGGAALVARFVRTYPVAAAEADDVEE
jgi:hypothetical protein